MLLVVVVVVGVVVMERDGEVIEGGDGSGGALSHIAPAKTVSRGL